MTKNLLIIILLLLSIGTKAQNSEFPVSLVGRAYHGIVKTSNAEYDRSYDCHYTIIFYSGNRCRAMQHLTSKGTTRDIVELAAISERSEQSHDFEYSYNNGQLRIIDDSGSMLIQDNGGKIKMIDDQALHGDIYLLSDEITKNLLNVIGFNGSTCAYKIDTDRILHRNYKGIIVKSSLSKIEMLLKEDVAGYYDIPGISTEVQKKVFAQSEDYKNVYLPRLKKEKEYLLQDEFEAYFIISATGCDVWDLDYDMPSKRFHFELRHNEPDRYAISNEKDAFHVYIGDYSIPYCFTYPKSLVSVVNGRSRNGKMGQEQTLFTCVIPETEAAQFYPNRHNTLLWRFKIEKIKNGRLYGKSTGLKVIEGTPDGSDILGVPRYRYVTLKEQTHKVVLDLSNTFSQKGNTFRSVKIAK